MFVQCSPPNPILILRVCWFQKSFCFDCTFKTEQRQHFWSFCTSKWPLYGVVDPLCYSQNFVIPRIHTNKRDLNWSPPDITESRTCHIKKGSQKVLVSSEDKFWTLPFLGWQVLGVAISGLCCLGFWVKGKLGGGKKDQLPCKLHQGSEQAWQKKVAKADIHDTRD